MEMTSLVRMSRSYRRFDEEHHVEGEVLPALFELAQYSPTGNNMQPMKF